MMIENHIEQVVQRLSDLAVRHSASGERPASRQEMAEKLHTVAGFVKEMSLDGQSMTRLVFLPLEAKLVERCGAEDGVYLCGEIVRAFRDEGSNHSR